MFCPECGNVYHIRGNTFNQYQPEWETEEFDDSKRTKEKINCGDCKSASRMVLEKRAAIKKKFAKLIFEENVDPVDALKKINKDHAISGIFSKELMRYAKIGGLLKIKG